MTTKTEKPSNSQRRVVLNSVRIAYPHILEPRAVSEGGDLKYSTVLLIPKDNEILLQKVKDGIAAAIADGIGRRWGGKKPAGLHMPLRDGDETLVDENGEPTGEYKKAGAEFRGVYYINAKSDKRPGVIAGRNRDPAMPEDVWPGQYAAVSVTFYPYSHTSNRGVGAGLNHVWLLGRGERLDGGTTPEDEFANVDAEFGDGDDDLLGDIA